VLEQLNLSARRDVPAGVLSYAEQRALEIGITIAGGADVILLDEPTAGMSRSETEHVIALIRQVTAGKTLLMVEHDMSVVFDLADRIAVLVYGEVIAHDTPARISRQRRRAGGVSRHAAERRLMLAVSDLHAFYGKSHILHGVTLTVGEGEIVSLLGRNGVGRSTTIRAIMGDVHAAGSVRFRDEEICGLPPYVIARKGLGYVPENRDIFPTLTVRQNLLLGVKNTAAPGTLDDGRHVRLVSDAAAARRQSGGVLSGGEQQMLTICRTLMGRPAPDHDRRADGRPGADARHPGGRPARPDRQAWRLDPARRAEAHHRADHLGPRLRDGPRARGLRGHAEDLRHNDGVRKEWLEV